MASRRRLPSLNALIAFDAVARNGSFTRAGQELTVAQPAVTRHIANLEGWLGVALFHPPRQCGFADQGRTGGRRSGDFGP